MEVKVNNKTKINWEKIKTPLFCSTLLAIFIPLYFRNLAGQFPGLLDEYYYNSFSRLVPYAEAWIPNYLFYFIYGLTNVCKSGFLGCVYFLNTLFYLLAFFPIYAVCKKLTSAPLAFYVSILIICSPANHWTGFFMPESVYFLFFWILIWMLCKLDQNSGNWKYLCLGMTLGLSALLKVHALFLTPALLLYIYYLNKPIKKIFTRNIAIQLAAFLFGLLVVKYGLSWVFTGRFSLSLFGAYSDVISNATDIINSGGNTPTLPSESPFSPINVLKRDALHSLAINTLPLFIFFGMPIAIIAQSVVNKTEGIKSHFFTLSALIILGLVGIIQLFQWTMLAIGQGQVELYWRYYEFALTLLLIAPAAYICSKISPPASTYRTQQLVVGGIVIFFIMLAIWNGTGSFWINIKINKVIFYGFAVGSMLAMAIWVYRPMLGSKLYLFLLLPASLIISNVAMNKHLQKTRMTPNSSAIGAFIESQLTVEDLKKVLVVQDSNLEQTVPLIFLKSPNLKFQRIGANDLTYDLKNVPKDRDWVILMGNHVLVGDALANTHMQYLSFGEITLFGGHGSIDINFQQHEWPGVIREQKGLFNPPEPWGAWSIDQKVDLKFVKPLPRKFDLKLTARAFGPNANRDIVVRIGDQTSKFQLPATFPNFETKSIRIDNPNRLSEISIDIPRPITPKELGQGDDDRRIGIGFTSMQIKW